VFNIYRPVGCLEVIEGFPFMSIGGNANLAAMGVSRPEIISPTNSSTLISSHLSVDMFVLSVTFVE
jgi:hypothetical protein